MSLILDADAPEGAAPPADLIKESDSASFVADVMEASKEVPVIVDFWATWCGPCKQLTPALEKAVTQMGGAVKLVKVDVDANQDLAMQFRVQSVPTVYAFKNGQPVDGFQGALPESQIKAFIERLTGGKGNPVDEAVALGEELLTQGDAAGAEQVFRQVLEQDRANVKALAGVMRAFMALDRIEDTKAVLAQLPDDILSKAEVQAVKSAVELAENKVDAGALEALAAKIAADPDDHQARYDLAMAHYANGDGDAAIGALLDSIAKDRDWDGGKAKEQLFKIFEALGNTDPAVVKGRRRLSSILFA